jgi:hypothetical protein
LRLLLNDVRQTTEIRRSRRAANPTDRPQGVAAMAAFAKIIGDLDYQGSGAYNGPAAWELFGATVSAWP